MTTNRAPFPLVPFVLGLLGLLFSLAALTVPALPASGATPEPTATATLPAECPDAPAPCAVDGYVDEFTDDNPPMEFDPDGRPVNCPPYPATCAVPGYEDGPPYPQNYDIDGNPLPTGPVTTPAPTPEPSGTFNPRDLDPDGRPVGCPPEPALCVYLEQDAEAGTPSPSAHAEPSTPRTKAPRSDSAPGLPKAGV